MEIVPGLVLGFIFIVIGYISGWKMQNSEGKFHHMTGLDEKEKTYVRKIGGIWFHSMWFGVDRSWKHCSDIFISTDYYCG